ncbi:oligoendopeptidase [Shouchella clausii]|uniref:M3 family oligoendopeptidase n=1 Tax=Shouchella TaxID=2893057 RepID=UPI000BA6E3B6|nr:MULTISPECIES: M3 family oligoendopeptidase [Shouchella]MCM3381947.1 M3 family oligoendopeptidase [Shouchella rhizosphaerae]PAD45143.1 oligoendopeptidase [Shouchella clausii]GIN18452.1 oligoendopeptidase [Shouchella clausii]
MQYPITWDLESIFAGGSQSEAFSDFLKETNGLLDRWQETEAASVDIQELVTAIEQTFPRLAHASAFVSCLLAQNVKDETARLRQEQVQELEVKWQKLNLLLEEKLKPIDDQAFASLLEEEAMKPSAFMLEKARKRAADKMSADKEELATKLAKDGYHAWGSVYNEAVGRMEIPFEENGEVKHLSAGQLHNRLSNEDRSVRKRAYEASLQAWAQQAPLITQTLNRLAGFRLKLYEERGWDNVLKEPLDINLISEETLTTMWDTITKNKSKLYPYMDKKAELLGLEKLSLFDVNAPLPTSETSKNDIPYEEACELIIKHFNRFSPKMAEFAEMALRNGWVEAENRAGKRPGGFCTTFPLRQESRIFMTYDGSMDNVATLAHELGHAYHSWCLKDMPVTSQKQYPMSIAETASTFAEMIVADALVSEAESPDVKRYLLENKLSRSLAFFMNIHSRFLFETRFYEERKQGIVPTERLNELMVEAQKEAYGNKVEAYDPYFWASKLHFHITKQPFYNFPYTFGYLFSMGLYARALKAGASFEDNYIALLQDSGSMTAEQLAQKHLQVDLTKPDFWQEAIDVVLKDSHQFVQ